jgi:hypothetical protein
VSPLDPMPETTRDRCITPSFSPSTYHRGKLMDGELGTLACCQLTEGHSGEPPSYRSR